MNYVQFFFLKPSLFFEGFLFLLVLCVFLSLLAKRLFKFLAVALRGWPPLPTHVTTNNYEAATRALHASAVQKRSEAATSANNALADETNESPYTGGEARSN